MEKKTWTKPEIRLIKKGDLEKESFKVLSIESSLYASGCHKGMFY